MPFGEKRPDEHGQGGEGGEELRRKRRQQSEPRPEGQQHERELARRREQGAAAHGVAPGRAEQAKQDRDDGDLGDEDGRRREKQPRPLLEHDSGIDGHADGHEEQAEQDAAERLDVGLELMAEIGFGQEHAGQEGAHGHGQAGIFHDEGRAEDDEQRRGGHHFARPAGGEEPEQRIKAVAADRVDETKRRSRPEPRQQQLPGGLGLAAGGRKERHEGQDRGDRQILEQKDREGALAVGRPEVPPLLEHLQPHRRGRKGERRRGHEGAAEGEACDKAGRRRHGRRGDGQLGEAEPEDVAAHGQAGATP